MCGASYQIWDEFRLPFETLVIVTFEEIGWKTKPTISYVGIPAYADHDGENIGWNQS